ncbi:MAG: TMEM175 family protein [Actinomycetes bacterium]
MKTIKNISVSKLSSLGDGIFSIAMTLLVLELIPAGERISEAPDFNQALIEEWPVFASFALGFLVIASIWYDYHALGQYYTETNPILVWETMFTVFIVTLIPFGVSLLGHSVNTPHMTWPVFYFGIILFARSPVTILSIYLARRKYGGLNLSKDWPVEGDYFERLSMVLLAVTTAYGALLIVLSLFNAWLALALYSVYVIVRTNPISSWNSVFKFAAARQARKG